MNMTTNSDGPLRHHSRVALAIAWAVLVGSAGVSAGEPVDVLAGFDGAFSGSTMRVDLLHQKFHLALL